MTRLEEICRARRDDVAACKGVRSVRDLEQSPGFRAPRRSMAGALRRPAGEPIRWLCELKKASPSAGPIRPDLDVAAMAERLVRAGADGLSVLTEGRHFGGRPEDLQEVRRAVSHPLLQKDFVVDEYQLIEARAFGADAVLLIIAALDAAHLRDLSEAARELGLDRLAEIHGLAELDAALALGPEMVGVNNRDLRNLEVDVATTFAVLPRVPDYVVRIAESGIKDRETVERIADLGGDAILIGEHLMRAGDPPRALRELAGRTDDAGPGAS